MSAKISESLEILAFFMATVGAFFNKNLPASYGIKKL
jgi:hypothetical protein